MIHPITSIELPVPTNLWLLTFYLMIALVAHSEEPAASRPYRVFREIPYVAEPFDDYQKQRCKLDVYTPKGDAFGATLIWFHGGGLRNGQKADAIAIGVVHRFTLSGIAVVSVNYRLSPEAKFPAYVEDAAAAVAWVRENIHRYGGDPGNVFVSGHSAGGYLTSMIAMAPQFLSRHGLKPGDFPGYLPIAGQMITHSTVREELGLSEQSPWINQGAPLYYVRKDIPPILSVCGDADLPARAAENLFFQEYARASGSGSVQVRIIQNRDHGTIASKIRESGDEVGALMIRFIQENSR